MSDNADLIARLRERLVMSMFASKADIYSEQEQQRSDAADALARLTAEHEALKATAEGLAVLADLRRAGWSVAVHNDYRLNGEAHTFWLMTHPNGRWIKGEGRTDAEALDALSAYRGDSE